MAVPVTDLPLVLVWGMTFTYRTTLSTATLRTQNAGLHIPSPRDIQLIAAVFTGGLYFAPTDIEVFYEIVMKY